MGETAVTRAAPEVFPEIPSDAALIAAVRGGDTEAYGELFERHADAARRMARSLAAETEADDLVSEAFAKTLVVLLRGEGPDTAFRPYLLTAVRRLHVDRARVLVRTRPTDDTETLDSDSAAADGGVVAGFEQGTAARAFATLPQRWQLVLWHLEVEGEKPADVAPLLGLTPNAVSALAYRAREGLRQAFVSLHAAETDDETCSEVRAQLGAFLRNDISARDGAAVDAHVRECRACAAIYLELAEVSSELRAVLAPVVLGAAASGYLAALAPAGHGVAASASGLLSSAVGHVRSSGWAKAVAGVAAVGVVAGALVGALHLGGDDSAVQASPSLSDAAVGGPTFTRGNSYVMTYSLPTTTTPDERDGRPGRAVLGTGAAAGTTTATLPDGGVVTVAPQAPYEPPTVGTPGGPGTSGGPATPGLPGSPTGPGQPGQPTPPGQPTQPVDPTAPTGPTAPTDPTDPTGPAEPTQPAEPPPPVGNDASVGTSARKLAGPVHQVDFAVAGLGADQSATLTVTLDRPAVGIHLDPRCDLISLGRLTCRVTGPAYLGIVVTTVPGVRTTVTAALDPAGVPDPDGGNNRSSVRLG